MTVYKLTQPGDCEGRSQHTVGHFTNMKDAMTVGNTGFGSAGMGGPEPRVIPVEVYSSIQEFAEGNPKYAGGGLSKEEQRLRLRNSALGKLTAEERAALGL